MDKRLVQFTIPADFVLERALPTQWELAYGHSEGWLTSADVVKIAMTRYLASIPTSAIEERLALLLSDELDEVPDLIAVLETGSEPREERARIWLYLSLAWVYEHVDQFDDPYAVVELLYADFDYPDEIADLVRFMPRSSRERYGIAEIDRNWRRFIDRVGHEYQQRSGYCEAFESSNEPDQ
jgi:hypothetical protein